MISEKKSWQWLVALMYFLHPENVRALPNEGVLPNVSSGVHREQQRQTTVSRTKDSKWQSPEDDANVVGLNAGKTEMRKKHKSFFKLLLWQQVTAMAMCAQGPGWSLEGHASPPSSREHWDTRQSRARAGGCRWVFSVNSTWLKPTTVRCYKTAAQVDKCPLTQRVMWAAGWCPQTHE